MRLSKFNIFYLAMCLSLSAILCMAHMAGSTLLILLVLCLFFLLVVFAFPKKLAIAVLLFYIPWSPLLKISQGETSWYTVTILTVALLYLVFYIKKMNYVYLIASFIVFGVTLFAKLINGYAIDNSYFLFIMLLCIFPAMLEEIEVVDYYTITCFFSFGIISAALSAQQLATYPNISKFIDVYTFDKIVRLSGFYGDANFYAAHITAALSAVLLLILYANFKKNTIFLLIIAVVLLYCGFLSGSKSFILVFACITILWLMKVLAMRGKLTTKIVLVISVISIGIFVLSSTLFVDVIDVILYRFNQSDDISSFTTGRTDIWLRYISVLINDRITLLFGKGFTNINIKDRASHNVFIQMVYQLGIIGFCAQIMWIICFIKRVYLKGSYQKKSMEILILIIGVFGPWFALDAMYFDEFFLMQLFFCVGLMSLRKNGDIKPKENTINKRMID